MTGGAFSLIRRFREIVKPYLNNVARCSSDVVLFLTRHVLFLSSHLLQPISNLFEKPCCSTPCRVSRFVSALFAVPKLSGPEHIATWSHRNSEKMSVTFHPDMYTVTGYMSAFEPAENKISRGPWGLSIYTHIYIYIYVCYIISVLYSIEGQRELSLCWL